MANRRQREERRRRRKVHSRGDDKVAIPQQVEPENRVSPQVSPQAPKSDPWPHAETLRMVGLALYAVSLVLWAITALFHRGHLGAGIACIGCALGMVIWAISVYLEDPGVYQSKAYSLRYFLEDVLFLTIIGGPVAGFGLAAILSGWWIGLVTGLAMTLGGILVMRKL